MDIDTFDSCRLLDIEIPDSIKHFFLGPAYGIDELEKYVNNKDKPLSGAIVKPYPYLKHFIRNGKACGGCDFIKEDEILSNPSFAQFKSSSINL